MNLFRRLRRTLAKELPPTHPTRVYRKAFTRGDPNHGYFYDMVRDGVQVGWKIEIRKGLDENAACETLLHEWAHVRAGLKSREEHTLEWGQEYAKGWRVYNRLLARQ